MSRVHHWGMKAYSEDLRKKKIVEALRRGMTKTEAAPSLGEPLLGQALRQAGRAGTLPRPEEAPRIQEPKMDERARRLLEAHLEERPAATLSERREYLRRVAGLSVSDSTVSRMVGRLGWSRKKDRWERVSETSS